MWNREQFSGVGVSSEWAWVARPAEGIEQRAVLLFVHGFGISPTCYSALCEGLAGQGFAVVAPYVYGVTERVGVETARIVEWSNRVCASIHAPFILAGHSRGGQAVMLSTVKQSQESSNALPKVHAIVLFDIVEGSPKPFGGLTPYLLRHGIDDWTLDLTIPVLVVGAELGREGCFPAAPEGHNFDAVWTNGLRLYCERHGHANTPDLVHMWKVAVKDFGHLDYLNDYEDCEGIIVNLSRYVVKSGVAGRRFFRAFVVLITAEFLRAFALPNASLLDVEAWRSRVESIRISNHVQIQAVNESGDPSLGSPPSVPQIGATLVSMSE
jgi:pimeloyl-ACP methyl ester carboxylesterase